MAITQHHYESRERIIFRIRQVPALHLLNDGCHSTSTLRIRSWSGQGIRRQQIAKQQMGLDGHISGPYRCNCRWCCLVLHNQEGNAFLIGYLNKCW